MLLDIFLTFIFIGAFSFGGGNAMYPLLLQELVRNHNWLTQTQLIDLFAFAQMTPGPVATNAATFVGYKLAGFSGAVVATAGVSLPSTAVMLVFVRFLVSFHESWSVKAVLAGLRPVVVALILGAGVIIARQSVHDVTGYIFIAASILGVKYFNIHPILLIIGAGLAGIVIY